MKDVAFPQPKTVMHPGKCIFLQRADEFISLNATRKRCEYAPLCNQKMDRIYDLAIDLLGSFEKTMI